ALVVSAVVLSVSVVVLSPAVSRAQDRAQYIALGNISEDTAERPSVDLPILRLDEILDAVRMENPSLRASYLEAEARQTGRRQVSSLPDPMVMGTYQPFPLLTARGAQRSQWRVEQTIP